MARQRPIYETFVGSENIMRRLRAAKRPEILVPLEVPAEEMDIEPETIDTEAPPIPLLDRPIDDLPALPLIQPSAPFRPAHLSADEIVPDTWDDED
jgi:hypothetical protein